MIKKYKLVILVVTVISLVFLGGCAVNSGASDVEEDVNNDPSINSQKIDEKGIELTLWCWYDLGATLSNFEAENKGITIKQEIFSFNDCSEKYMEAITSGEGPDIFMFDSGFFNQYTVNNVLQDLLQEPFSAGKYEKDFLGWQSGFSVDKKQLLSLTVTTAPYVTLYRADVMEQNGFPSDPEEFGKFIENPENILKIAKKLKETNKYIFQYPTDITDIVGASLGYFDDNFNYIRTGDLFARALDISREAYQNDLMLDKSFWGEEGKKAVLEDKLVMISGGSYAMGTLERYAPEQSGKWRMAKAFLGLSAWTTDSRIAINIQSEHKEEAWKLVQYIATQKGDNFDVVPGYIPAHNNSRNMERKLSYLGDQIVYPMLEDLSKKMLHFKLTPMDTKALSMYRTGVWESVKSTKNIKDAVKDIKTKIDEELAEEKTAFEE